MRSIIIALLLAGLVTPAASGASDRPPNIVFILADDLGWSELGCYGNTFNETPNIDRLASRGLRFTNAYAAAPVCSPTRAALMTGQYPARVGITDFLRGDDKRFLSAEYFTIAEAMKSAGYATGLVGKWHLMGDYALRKGDPALHGFDEVICSETLYIADGDYFAPYKFMPQVKPLADSEYLTDRLSQEAVQFIRRHREQPFFLYLAHYAVHTKLDGKPKLVARFRNKPGAGEPGRKPQLAAMLASVDEGVGQVMKALDELGLQERTLVIFTSDNGGELRVTTNAPLRGGKSQLYEGGIREPLIVAGPGVKAAGRTCDAPVVTVDFYPTFLELAGAKPQPGQVLDGVSITSLLNGERELPDRAIFWHFALDEPLKRRAAGAIRRGDYKLIEFHDTGEQELYDLKADLSEAHNLASQMPDMRARLSTQLNEWRAGAVRGDAAASRPVP